MTRMYGRDRNVKEDERLCIAEVSEPPHYVYHHQCKRARGHGPGGLYCKQHGEKAESGSFVQIGQEAKP